MTDSTLRIPSPRTVVGEQLRTVGLALRWELRAMGALLAVILLSLTVIGLVPGVRIQVDADFPIILNPEDLGYLAIMLGVAAPLGVWKGEKPFGDSVLWTLPVERRRNALIKVGAGWGWLMGVVAAGVLVFALGTLVTGGEVGVSGSRFVFTDRATGAIEAVPWSTPWWQWVIPFTAATAAYGLSSALIVGTRHPWWWAVGLWMGLLAVGGMVELADTPWMTRAGELALEAFDRGASGGVETLRGRILIAGDQPVHGWFALPSFGPWALATAVWMAVAGLALTAALARHREG